jgi:hypothetical protein
MRHIHLTIVAVEKAGSITYSEYVSVAFVIQHAMHMHHNVIYGLSDSTIFFHISHKEHDFQKKKLLMHKV